MTPTKGFFSVIQFCPDLDRAECANVGVVLVAPAHGFLEVHMSDDNEGPKQRFGRDAFDDRRLSFAKQALTNRLREEGKGWQDAEQLRKFGRMEGNNLVLSPPRTIVVEDPQADLAELYQRLVHVDARHRRRQPKPDLNKVFDVKLSGVPLRRDLEVEVPKLGKLDIPYAYKNGRLNLIRPEGFPIDEGSAETKANDLAVKAHLLYTHPSAAGEEQKLIVVGGFDASASEELKQKIEFVLKQHDSRLVREEQLEQFADEVAREAHS
jgi:hypothetical protein